MARAPARAYMPFTGVAGRGEAITSATPRLGEPCRPFSSQRRASGWTGSLSTGPEGSVYRPAGGQMLPVRAQSVAAANNLALMAGAISRITTGATSISAKEVPEKPPSSTRPCRPLGYSERRETATLAFKKVEEDRMLLSRHLPLARPSRPDTSRKAARPGASAKRRVRRQKLEATAESAAPGAQAESFRPPLRGHSKRPAALRDPVRVLAEAEERT
ncbi:hypothetical protein DPEC_G00377310 [Dallia pectoralis]|nr:hypothetical protein DPEC_G00377310 [Dallia pectoralis]